MITRFRQSYLGITGVIQQYLADILTDILTDIKNAFNESNAIQLKVL